MPWTQNILEKRQVALSVIDIVGGAEINPTSYSASVAFVAPGVLPQASDWYVAGWVYDSTTYAYYAQVLIGPNDGNAPQVQVTLGTGTYVAYVSINTGSELWLGQVDTVTITGGNYTVPVVSVNDLAVYMGYPFGAEQIPAAQLVLNQLTAQLEALLKADLSIQQWTESYTVPGGPSLWNNSIFGTNVADIWMETSELPLGMMIAPIYVKHWPIVSWDALAIQVPAQQGPTIAQTTEPIPYGSSIFSVTCTPLSEAITSGPIVINDLGAPGGIGNTLQANTSGASAGSTVIPLNAVDPLAPLVAGANIMLAAGVTWLSLTPPTYPEDLPEFLPGQSVQVTYTAGWDGATMPDVRGAVLRAAARELTNRLDTAVGLHGGLNTVNLPDGPGNAATMNPGFSPNEIQPLKRYKRRVIV